jgi:hypothetical protein
MREISLRDMQIIIQDCRSFADNESLCEGYQRSIVLACAQILESVLENREEQG